HLAAPGVAGDRGDLGLVNPFQRLERKTGRVAAGIAVPASDPQAALHLPGPHDDEVAAPYGAALGLGGLLQILRGDGVAVIGVLLAHGSGHVEEHAAADHLVLGLLDPAFLRTGGRYFAAVVAVPHVVLIEDVAEPVPLGAALERHHHHVVGGADAAL